MLNQKNLLPTLCHLCGMKPTRNIRRFSYDAVMTRLKSMYLLKEAGGGSGFSPLHLAADLNGGENISLTEDLHINLVEGMFLAVNFVVGTTNVLVLPRTKGADNIARIWAYIVSHKTADQSGDGKKPRFAYILVNPAKITPDETRIGTVDLDGIDPADIRSTYDAFVTAALTDDETDFDIEVELQGVRTRSNVARERIKRRMQKMGIRVLKGKRASIFLRQTPLKCTVDLKRLQAEFPDAYAACVENGKRYEFISVKLHDNQNR